MKSLTIGPQIRETNAQCWEDVLKSLPGPLPCVGNVTVVCNHPQLRRLIQIVGSISTAFPTRCSSRELYRGWDVLRVRDPAAESDVTMGSQTPMGSKCDHSELEPHSQRTVYLCGDHCLFVTASFGLRYKYLTRPKTFGDPLDHGLQVGRVT